MMDPLEKRANSKPQPDPRALLKIGLRDEKSLTLSSESTPTWNPPEAQDLDASLPDFEVQELIGRGGMAAVYRVKSQKGSLFALKLLPRELASNPVLAKRFGSEIEILKSLQSPYLVTIHGTGHTLEKLPYYIMDEMKGGDLAKLGQLPPDRTLVYMEQICTGLHHLHSFGLLHRDLKTSNILLNENLDGIKIADFGLAKSHELKLSQMSLTRTGTQVGTLHFLAPELFRNADHLSVQSDLYSLAVIFYQLLTDNLPIGHFEPVSKIPGISTKADPFFEKALSADPDKRFSSAPEFKTAMTRAFTPTSRVKRRAFIASGTALATGGALAYFFKEPPTLTSQISITPLFDVPMCHPWTSENLWGNLSPEQFRLNHFFANPEGHLIHHADDQSDNTFPGKSLTLRAASTFTIVSIEQETHIANLTLDGGTVSAELVNIVTPEIYPDLFDQVVSISENKAVLTGKIHIAQTSNFTGGRSGVHQLTIASSLTGSAPMYISPPRKRIAVILTGDNRHFSGGWFIQGQLISRGPHSLGTGPISIDRGRLIVEDETTINSLSVEQNGVVIIKKALIVASAHFSDSHLPPGTYRDLAKVGIESLTGPGTLTVLGTKKRACTIYQSPVNLSPGKPEIIVAKESGRWDRDQTWAGPQPGRGRHDETGLTVSPRAYRVPSGIVLQGTFLSRGLEYFGGCSLTLEPGSVLELEGSVAFFAFAELRLAGGEVRFGERYSMMARELIGGNLIIEAPTLFRLPNKNFLQEKDFILQGKIQGNAPISFYGDLAEYLYINADTSKFTGGFEILKGTI
ncbi:MAG: serine/threonine protein kinase, partial [Paracoccaceae bacterium]